MRAAYFTQSSDILSNELSASAFVRMCVIPFTDISPRAIPQKKANLFFSSDSLDPNRSIFLIIISLVFFGFGFNFIYLLDSIMNEVRLNEFAENRMPFIDV